MNKELEEAIYRINFHKDNAELANGTCVVNKQDIEVVLNELKRLKEENKDLKQANREKADKLIEITDLYIKSIPKDKVREKIEELKNDRKTKYDSFMGYRVESREQQDIDKQIKILQELLEGK